MQFWKRPHGPEQLRSYSDEALCREVLQGNQEAFLVLFDRYWLDVFRLAHSVLRNDAAAEDLIQDLFLEVHTTMLRYDEHRGAFRTLLLRYAYTRAIDHRRQLESRRYYVTVQIEQLEPEVFSRDVSLYSGLSLEEGTRLIEQGLEYLEDKQRATVTAYFFRGLSVQEIAAEMGESYGNTRHHLYRGLERMRKLLAPKEEGDETAEPESPVTLRLHRRVPKRVGQEVSLVRARSI
jgi:RNA polymerase sigma-70 factor, ECF subfamily